MSRLGLEDVRVVLSLPHVRCLSLGDRCRSGAVQEQQSIANADETRGDAPAVK